MTTVPMMLTRRPDWEIRLVQFINTQLGEPFEWGKRDCTSLALNSLKAMVGEFSHPDLSYTDEKQAIRYQVRLQMGLYDFMRLQMDVMPIERGFQQRGDILFVKQGPFECCHIVMGDTYCSVTPARGVGTDALYLLPPDGVRPAAGAVIMIIKKGGFHPMGCDIHGYVEVKINGAWHVYNQPRIPRYYPFFSYLAGVRADSGDPEPLAAGRGLPDDLSIVTQAEYENWKSDAHSESWLTMDETDAARIWYQENCKPFRNMDYSLPFGYLAGDDFTQDALNNIPGATDCRFVFWFDN